MAWDDGIKLSIGITSNHDHVDRAFMMHLLHMIKPRRYYISLAGYHIKSASLNEHLTVAGNEDCTHILFLDVDMQFPIDTIPKLMSHQVDIVSGLYHLKETPFSPICGWTNKNGDAVNGDGKMWKYSYCPLPANQLVEVHWTGIGCLLVNMKVFDRIYFPPFKDIWNDEMGVRQKGHDVLFCENARKAGHQVWVDTSVDCTHIGKLHVSKTWVDTYHRLGMDHEILKTIRSYSAERQWWNDKWGMEMTRKLLRVHPHITQSIQDLIPAGVRVADLGCGDGWIMEQLQKRGIQVYGYDFSPTAIEYLKSRGMDGEVADLRTWSPNGHKYHTVILSHVLEHMQDEDRIMDVVAQMTENQAFVVVPKEKELFAMEHLRLYDEEKLLVLAKRHFENVHVSLVHRPGERFYGDLIAHCRGPRRSGEVTLDPVFMGKGG
jgi:2-polyprenyl-3-methyl-5-hydroxy-6-metoxy-1,4-benzoquinol methylase